MPLLLLLLLRRGWARGTTLPGAAWRAPRGRGRRCRASRLLGEGSEWIEEKEKEKEKEKKKKKKSPPPSLPSLPSGGAPPLRARRLGSRPRTPRGLMIRGGAASGSSSGAPGSQRGRLETPAARKNRFREGEPRGRGSKRLREKRAGERKREKDGARRGANEKRKNTTDNSTPTFISLTFGFTEESPIGFSLATTRRGAPGAGRKEGAWRSEGASGGEAKRRRAFLVVLLLLLLFCAEDGEGQQQQQTRKNSAMREAGRRLIVRGTALRRARSGRRKVLRNKKKSKKGFSESRKKQGNASFTFVSFRRRN